MENNEDAKYQEYTSPALMFAILVILAGTITAIVVDGVPFKLYHLLTIHFTNPVLLLADLTAVAFFLAVRYLSSATSIRQGSSLDIESLPKKENNEHATIENVLLSNCFEAVRILDEHGRVSFCNPSYLQMAEAEDYQIIGKHFHEVFPSNHASLRTHPVYELLQGKPMIESEVIINEENQFRHLQVRSIPIKDQTGKLLSIIEIYKDITAVKKAEKRLKQLAITDSTTGLFNRKGFIQAVRHQIHLSKRKKRQCHLIYCDIDNIRQVNDAYGHDMGDEAILEIARLLRSIFPKSDTIGRLDGVTFGIMATSDPGSITADEFEQRIEMAISELNSSGKSLFPLSLSIGILYYSHTDYPTLDKLLSAGDKLMDAIKREKRR